MIEITTRHSRSSYGIPVVLRDGEILNDWDPVTAAEVAELLGIPDEVTTWFNHSGAVPASAVVEEYLRRS